MDITQLALFLEVFRAGGFAPVARSRHVAPSSVSRAIAAIEEELGALLFQRTTRALAPTDAGEAFFARIAPLVEEFEAARDEARDAVSGPSGRLRVTASVSYGQIVLAPQLKAFRQLYPDLAIDLFLSDRQVDLVSDRIDLAIRHGALPDSSMVARKLRDVRYRLVASPEYVGRAPKLRTPRDLSSHNLIAFSYEGFRNAWSFRKGRVVEEVPISPMITVSNAAALAECARQGLGLALLADWTVAVDLDAGRLVEVFPGWTVSGTEPETAIWLVWPSRRFVHAKVRAFADWLTKEANSE